MLFLMLMTNWGKFGASSNGEAAPFCPNSRLTSEDQGSSRLMARIGVGAWIQLAELVVEKK